MRRNSVRRAVSAGVLAVVTLLAASCSAGGDSADRSASGTTPDCPSPPVNVLVSVDQWGDIVSQLGGGCARVKTLLASSSTDPHDYEPSPADAASFEDAQLVVINGGHYDEWAAKLAASSAPGAGVVNAVQIAGGDARRQGNPHVWYDPAVVVAVADAVTAELSKLAPAAADYFAQRRADFTTALAPYRGAVDAIKAGAAGKTYAATEGVFDDMSTALGLQNRTPPGYQAAARNETDPSPGDLAAFLSLLGDKGVDVLIFNTQTEGSVPDQLRSAAEAAAVPVVDVTETVAPGSDSFEAWQVDQLTALGKALGVSV